MFKSRFKPGLAGLMLLLAALAVAPASAADDKKSAEQLRRLQGKLRAVELEKSALVQGKSDLDSQLKEGADKLAQLRRSADNAARQRAVLEHQLNQMQTVEGEKTALADKVTDLEKRLAEGSAALAELATKLRLAEQTGRQRETELSARAGALSECEAKNGSLHRVGVDLLKQYEQKSCVGSGLQRELLTQIKRVGVENMVDEYSAKLDQDLLTQQLQDRKLQARQRADKVQAEQARIAAEQAERARASREQSERRQARQQNDLDKMTRKVKDVLESFEW